MAFFQVWFESGFQRASFQVCLSRSASFLSSEKFRVGFVESLKSASRFFALVLVNFGFERLCQFLFAKFTVGFVGSQNRRVFYSKVSGKLSLQNFVGFFFALSVLGKVKFSKIIVLVCLAKFFQQAFWQVINFWFLRKNKVRAIILSVLWLWFWLLISASCTKPANTACT